MGDIERYLSEEATFTIPTRDLLFQYGHAAYAMLYYTIFFPEFTEVEGSVLIKEETYDVEPGFHKAKLTSKRNIWELEAAFNRVEVAYLFQSESFISNALEIKLCEMIRNTWEMKLLHDYPSRRFSVYIVSPEQSGSVYCVEFFENRELE